MLPFVIAVIILGSVGALAGCLLWMYSRGRSATDQIPNDSDVVFAPERYAVMDTLLQNDDLDFLISQPGYRPEIGARFRKHRRRIFRLYLLDLANDFRALHAQARRLVAVSDAASSALVGMLLKQQAEFWLAVAVLEIRLALHAAGVGRVEVRGLLGLMDTMRIDIANLVPAQGS